MILLSPCRSGCRTLALVAALACARGNQAPPEPPPAARAEVPAGGAAALPASTPAADPYHPTAQDTVDAAVYDGWKQYFLQCSRCHGEDANGSSFGPSLLVALKPDGSIPSQDEFVNILTHGRRDKGMPSAATMGLEPAYFPGLYRYLKGRSDGSLRAGRPARRTG
jgi:mono/diheme cytochrome c family protein